MHVSRITTLAAFDAERARWEELERADPHVTVFTSWRWLRAYLPVGRYRWSILTLRDGDTAVAYLPIGYGGSPFDRELYMAGNPIADYTGMLVAPGFEEAAISGFAADLAAERWDAFNALDAHDPRIEPLMHRLVGRGYALETTGLTRCLSAALPPTWDEFAAHGISAKTRVNTVRVERRLAAALPGFRISEPDATNVDAHVDALVRLNHARWGGNFASARRRYGGLFRNAHAAGILRLFLYWDGARAIGGAAAFLDAKQSTYGLYMIAFDEAYARFSPGKGIIGRAIRDAIESGFARFDFLRGDEPFKARYAGEVHATRHFRVTAPGLRAAAIAYARPKFFALKLAVATMAFGPGRQTERIDDVRPKVLVAGLDPGRNASRLPLMLAAAGCRITALCPNDTSLAHSRLVERHVANDRDDDAATVAAMRRTLDERFDLVVIADEAMLIAMASRLQPWMSGVLPVAADFPTCELILDKHHMLRAMSDAGVAIPPFITVEHGGDVAAAAAQIGYPLLLKDTVGCGGVGVRRVEGPDALASAYASLSPAGAVTLQRFIQGRSGCTDLLYDRGVPRCWTSAFMLDQWPTPFDPATVREPVAEPRVEAMARAVGAATGFHGLGGIDWIRDADGRLYFLEFNARVTHVVGPARPAFACEIGAMLAGVPAEPHEIVLPSTPIPIFPIAFIRALKLRRGGDLLGWLPFRSTSADLNWKDYGVVGFELGQMVSGAFRRVTQFFGAKPAPVRDFEYTRRMLQPPDPVSTPLSSLP